jgi:hypothetical protein
MDRTEVVHPWNLLMLLLIWDQDIRGVAATLGNRLPEMEVDARHGTQQAVFTRRRLERVSKYGCRASFVGHRHVWGVILCTVYLSEVISLI